MKSYSCFRIIFIVILFYACQNNNSEKDKEKASQEEQSDQDTSINYDCLHCGMPSQDFPEWHGKFIHAKGENWTCSPRCMFFVKLKKEHKFEGLKSIEVVDYYSQNLINARKAFYVTGSDIVGPMGADLVPFSEKSAAEDFLKEHKGRGVLSFEEVSLEKIEDIVAK